jgi:hypothetical protein
MKLNETILLFAFLSMICFVALGLLPRGEKLSASTGGIEIRHAQARTLVSRGQQVGAIVEVDLSGIGEISYSYDDGATWTQGKARANSFQVFLMNPNGIDLGLQEAPPAWLPRLLIRAWGEDGAHTEMTLEEAP